MCKREKECKRKDRQVGYNYKERGVNYINTFRTSKLSGEEEMSVP
jgi:hypothetical protein